MIYLITFIYIVLKAGYDTYRIHRNWGGKDIKHYWIDIITGFIWLVVWIWGEATFLDVSLFYVFYSLGFSPLLNLFRVKFLGHLLGERYDELRTALYTGDTRLIYKWGDVVIYEDGTSTWINKFPWWSYSQPLAILCYRSRAWYDRLHEIIFPGSDLRMRWTIDLALLGLLIYLRS